MAIDDLIRASTSNNDAVADALVELLVKGGSDFDTSLDTIATSTLTNMAGLSIAINVGSNDIVIADFRTGYSASDNTTGCEFYIAQNGSVLSDSYYAASTTSVNATTGNKLYVGTQVYLASPATGSVTYTVQWRRSAGSGTGYSDNRFLRVLVLRNT